MTFPPPKKTHFAYTFHHQISKPSSLPGRAGRGTTRVASFLRSALEGFHLGRHFQVDHVRKCSNDILYSALTKSLHGGVRVHLGYEHGLDLSA